MTLVAGCVFTVVALVGLASHWLNTTHQLQLVVASFAYLLVPASLVAVVVFLVGRHWWSALAVGVVIVLQVVAYGPMFVAQTAPEDATPVRVMTQNMEFGGADARTIVDRLRDQQVDVLALEELTPQAVDALYAAGIKSLMPFGWWRASPGADGTGIWSRIPFTQATAARGFSMFTVTARLRMTDGQVVSLIATHPSAPFPQDPARWVDDLGSLRALMLGQPAGPVIVAGDFNSTWDHARFRGLLTGGYRDAAEQAGAGLVRSWPADRLVPVIGIDHVLTRGAVATSFELVHTPNTDHLGVVVDVAVPTAS